MKSARRILHAILTYKITTRPPLYKPILRFVVYVTSFIVLLWGSVLCIINSSDSFTLANGVSIALVSLAAVCFSLSRSIKDNGDYLSDRILYAGERLLHGSMLIIVSTALRYSLFMMTGPDVATLHIAALISVKMILSIPVVVFGIGMGFASTGFRILSDVMSDRMFRYSDWDNVI